MSGSFEQNRIPTIADVFQFHENIHRAIDSQLQQERAARSPQPDAIFFGMTPDEVGALFLRLDQLAMLDLLSTAEAYLRVDCQNRVRKRRKDALSRQFRSVAKHRPDKVRLAEDILDGWSKHHPGHKTCISEFKAALKLRNWLAHGRYWYPKLGKSYTRRVVCDICDNLVTAISSQP